MYRLLNTCAMEWKDHVRPGAGELTKVLYVDPKTQGYVHLRYMPPSSSTKFVKFFHPTVRELGFWLWGDLQSVNFTSPQDDAPPVDISTRYQFFDRPPRSVHGARPGVRSWTGCLFLLWSTHGGEFEVDPAESIPVDADTPAPEGGWTMPLRIQMAKLPWEEHPAVPSWKIKYGSPPDGPGTVRPGIAPVSLVLVPPGSSRRMSISSASELNWLFVVHGGLSLSAGASEDLRLMEGCYLEWDRSARLEFQGKVADEGCIMLCVGHYLA